MRPNPELVRTKNAFEAYVGKKLFECTSKKMIPTEDREFSYEYHIES